MYNTYFRRYKDFDLLNGRDDDDDYVGRRNREAEREYDDVVERAFNDDVTDLGISSCKLSPLTTRIEVLHIKSIKQISLICQMNVFWHV